MTLYINGISKTGSQVDDIHSTSATTEVFGKTFPFLNGLGVIDSDPGFQETRGADVTSNLDSIVTSFQITHLSPGPVRLESVEIDLTWRAVVGGAAPTDFAEMWWEFADSDNPNVWTRFTDIVKVFRNTPLGDEINRHGRYLGNLVSMPITFRLMARVNGAGTTLESYLSSSCYIEHNVQVD